MSHRGSEESNSRPRRPGLGLVWAIISLLFIPVTGCERATPAPDPVTIAFAHPNVDEEHYEPLVQEFNRTHLDVTVELHPMVWDQLNDLSAEDADVFVAGASALDVLQEQGGILSLDPFIEQDKSFDLADFYPGALELLTSEGKTWAIPAGVDVNVMYYNQDLFDQHGLPYPEIGWTWVEFLNSALAISDPDAGIFGYTTTPGYVDAALFIYQHGGRIVDDPRYPTQTTFDEPATIEALEWYAKLFHEHQVAPTPAQARKAFGGGQYASYDGLRHGKVGMWVLWLSERGGMGWPVEWFVNWGVAPLPRDAQTATIASLEGYAISSEAERPDACWEWILFLSEQVTYRLMPARQSLAGSAAYEQLAGERVAAVARASMEDAMLVSPSAWTEFEESMTIFWRGIDAIVKGDATPEEAMDRAQREAERRQP